MPTLVSESKTVRRELWTAEDFLDWLEPGVHADLIDGEKFMHSPVSLRHARLLNFVDSLLRRHIEKHLLGELFREVVAVHLGSRNVFLPDLAFIPTERLPDLLETHIPFAPPLIVEVLSPRTADRDVGPKFAAYEEHGVQEYWVLDPQTLDHRFYYREGEILTAFAEGEEDIVSRVLPGLRLQRSWLDPEKLLDVGNCV
ncbi:MAG: Uma2 family endonuclease [Verrucomicrobiales bacterium]